MHTYRHEDMKTGRQTDIHEDRKTDRHTCRHADRQTYIHADMQTGIIQNRNLVYEIPDLVLGTYCGIQCSTIQCSVTLSVEYFIVVQYNGEK